MAKKHHMNVRLSVDAYRVVQIHKAANPHLSSMNDAFNDLLVRYEAISKELESSGNSVSFDELVSHSKELQSTLEQLTVLTLRNYGLNVEIASGSDPDILQKGETRARQLLKQLKEK